MDSLVHGYKTGTAKLVLFGRDARLGDVRAKPSQVLIVTTMQELRQSDDVLRHLSFSGLSNWSPIEKRGLRASCFARVPGPIHATSLTDQDYEELKTRYHKDAASAFILNQADLYWIVARRYDPVEHGNALQLTIHPLLQAPAKVSVRAIQQSIGWMLLDVILAAYLLMRSKICHGDLKLNNLVHDPSTHRFKIIDFGLAATYAGIDYKHRFGPIVHPWYHPIFRAIFTIPDTNPAKKQLQRRYAGLIDRFAFVGLVYQFEYALGAGPPKLESTVVVELKVRLCQLLAQFRAPEWHPANTPPTKKDMAIAKHRANFVQQSTKWLDRSKAHFEKEGATGAVRFCRLVKTHKLYHIAPWTDIFRKVVAWAWPAHRPMHLESLQTFLETRRSSKKVPLKVASSVKKIAGRKRQTVETS